MPAYAGIQCLDSGFRRNDTLLTESFKHATKDLCHAQMSRFWDSARCGIQKRKLLLSIHKMDFLNIDVDPTPTFSYRIFLAPLLQLRYFLPNN